MPRAWRISKSGLMVAVLAAGGVALLGSWSWQRSLPLDEAAAALSEYNRHRETVRTFIHGKLDMGKWRAHMTTVCVTIPDKPVWSVEDVEQLLPYVRRPAEPGEAPADRDGRQQIAVVAGDSLVARYMSGQGMTEAAAKRIREFMLEELRTANPTQRTYVATSFMSLRMHYSDPEVRAAVLKLAHDPDKWTAHVIRLNLGYARDWVKRAVASKRPGVDPAWADDTEIEALAK